MPAALAAGCDSEEVSTPNPGDPTLDGGPVEPFKATIRRTSMGVPHIKADDLGGAGYGYGYAFAEDNLCILMEEILTVRGQRAKYFGDVPYDLGNTESSSNVNSDAFYRMMATQEVIDKSRDAIDADLQKMIRGYAAGVSRYVRELKAGQHPGRHATCRNEEWARQITDDDLYLRYFKLTIIASSANFIDAVATAQPVNANIAPPLETQNLSGEKLKEVVERGIRKVAPGFLDHRDGDLGSNMYAFGSDVTGGGGIQFGNPHFPWYGGERLYQVHLTVPGKMDVQGASLYGVPVVLIGFTDSFAWSHTVSTAYRFTPYRLKLKPGDQLTYIQDGQEKKITQVDLNIEVKGEAPRAVKIYKSEYGPMINLSPPLSNWTTTEAFTMRDANAENYRLIRQFARWNMAKTFAEFKQVQAEEVATPWVNTTAADKDGNAYYSDLTVVPNVPDDLANKCKVTGLLAGGLAQSAPGLPFLDGSRAECNWVVDPAAAQPGAFAAGSLPKVERKDWVVNCNDSFWLTNSKEPTTGYATIIGRTNYAQTLRSRLCHQQVLDRVAGTDGFPGTTMTAEIMKQIAVGSRVYSAEKWKTPILTAVCATPTISLTSDPISVPAKTLPAKNVDTAAACAALTAWDNRDNPESKGSPLWTEVWLRVEGLFRNEVEFKYETAFSAADPVNTPTGLKTDTPGLLQAFAAAIDSMQTKGFALDAPRSAVSWRAGKGGNADRIPVPGGFQRVGNFTIAQTKAQSLVADTGYGSIDIGNSYLQVVAFTPAGVDASTFVTYGLSTDTANEHYDDYTRAYGQKQWLKAAFTEADVAADTKSTTELQQ